MRDKTNRNVLRFPVAFSFPGEYRDYVEQVDMALSQWLPPKKIFYDKRFEAEIAGFDGDIVLQKIYHDQAELIVVFLCKEYELKEWCCNVEWRAIRDLIKTRKDRRSILPLRFDTAEIPGIYSIDIVPDISGRTPKETAALIWHRLQVLRDKPSAGVGTQVKLLAELHGVPSLPTQFLDRPDLLSEIKQQLLQGHAATSVGLIGVGAKVGIHGMGGVGKTVLATALAHDEEIRRSFPDGIYWLTIGLQEADDGRSAPDTERQDKHITRRQRQLANALKTREAANFDDIDSGKAFLEPLLKDKVCLLILDDVWEPKHAAAFNVLGPRGRILITTRIGRVIKDLGGKEVDIHLLNNREGKELLSQWAGEDIDQLPAVVNEVVKECGYLPLALSMVGASVRMREDDRATVWSDVLEQLREADLENIVSHSPDYQYPHLLKAMAASLQQLGSDKAERYIDFSVFPEDQPVPSSVIEVLWRHHGMSGPATRNLLAELVDRSLVKRDDIGRLCLHDLQADYVRKVASDLSRYPAGLAARHQSLLDGYADKCGKRGWPDGPDDGYYFQWLPQHVRQAGREDLLCQLLWNPEWYRAKMRYIDVYALMLDIAMLDTDKELRLVRNALDLSAAALERDKTHLASQLVGRLLSLREDRIETLIENIVRSEPGPWLRPVTPELAPPGGSLLRTLEGHRDTVSTLVLTPDGRVVSGSDDATLGVWDLASGRCLRTLKGHTGEVTALVLTPDGRVVSGSRDGTLKVWDLATGECLNTLAGHTAHVTAIGLTPDGKAVSASDLTVAPRGDWISDPEEQDRLNALQSDATLRVWDLMSGECLQTLEGHTDTVNTLVLTPDGRVVSGSRDGTLKVWNLTSGECLQTLEGHTREVTAVALVPDGKAVSGSGSGFNYLSEDWDTDGTLKVWDLTSGECLQTLEGHTGNVTALAVTPDGRVVSGSDDATLRVWDLASGRCLRTLKGHTGEATALALTPDGRVVSGSRDGTLKVWNLTSGECLQTLEGHTDTVNALVLTPDGKAVSGSGDNTLRVWDLASGERRRTPKGHTKQVTALSLTPDGRVVSGSRDGTLKVWNLTSGECLQTLEGHTDTVNTLVLTPDGKAVSGSGDATLRVWNLASGECLQALEGHTREVTAVALAPDDRVVSGSGDGTLRVWDLVSGACLRTLEGLTDWKAVKEREEKHGISFGGATSSVTALALAPDGRIVSGVFEGTLRVWDLASGECLRTLKGHTRQVTALAVTPDGRIVSGSEDRILKVWDLVSGERLHILTGHTGEVTALAVTLDGRIVSGSRDGTLKVWDLVSGECLRTLEGVWGALALTPNGRFVLGSGGNTLRVWDLASGEFLASFTGESPIYTALVTEDTIVAGDGSGHLHFLRMQGF